MLAFVKPLHERLQLVPQVGRVTWLGVRPEHGAPMQARDELELIAGGGASGDVASRGRVDGTRQLTLFQEEHFPVLAGLTGTLEVRPEQLRRNVAVAGINLLALIKLHFQIGEAILIGTGNCAPCQKLDQTLGPGGFQAARGHGGITARIVRGGAIRIGDPVRVVALATSAPAGGQP
jgi:MOSC domain-containing protein YiiM